MKKTAKKTETKLVGSLTDKKVVQLIGLWNRGFTQTEIAEKLNVTLNSVQHVTKGSTWKQFSHLITR